jgi:hypothetical protein
LFASDTIPSGDLLIQLPLSASINGKNMPCTYEIISNSSNENGADHMTTTTATSTTTGNTLTVKVSPWLRCLASLIKELRLHEEIVLKHHQQQQQQSSHYYLASLPQNYETIWQWSPEEIDEYLAGTRPPSASYQEDHNNDPTNGIPKKKKDKSRNSSVLPSTVSSVSNQWMSMNDPKQIRQQYERSIRPYLIHCGILKDNNDNASNVGSNDNSSNDGIKIWEEKEYQQFQHACQILSTRSFYSSISNSHPDDKTNTVSSDDNTKYDGPYLLPIIDLINHADTCTGQTNTRLEFMVQNPNSMNPTYCFMMRALRTIYPHTEILHSYGDELSNVQFLSSFGFIPMNRMVDCCQPPILEKPSADTKPSPSAVSPSTVNNTIHISSYTKSVMITKQEIWDSCWDIIRSGFAQQLAVEMLRNAAFDPSEVWVVTVDRHRDVDCVPNHIVIVQPPTTADSATTIGRSDDILSDELVTAACVPFLPKCAYAEITSRTLLDVSILQDYYLGHLVGTALLQTIQRRLLLYRPIPVTTVQRILPSELVSDNVMDDKDILRKLLLCIETSSRSDDDSINKSNESTLYVDTNSKSAGDPMNEENESTLYVDRCRLANGLAIRLEEKEVLKALRNSISDLLNGLKINIDDVSTDDNQFDSDNASKKYKSSSD